MNLSKRININNHATRVFDEFLSRRSRGKKVCVRQLESAVKKNHIVPIQLN
jgi:hypothetical protein